MRKHLIETHLREFEGLKTKTFTAEEDLIWYRLNKLLLQTLTELNRDKQAIAEQALKDGVVFLEDGQPDEEKSDADGLKKANEKTILLINEEFETNVLPIGILNKIKSENDIPSGDYNSLLHLYLKE